MDKYSQTMYFSNKDIPIEKKKIIKMEGKELNLFFIKKFKYYGKDIKKILFKDFVI